MPFCHTCNKPYESLGIARHRAMHRDKKEDCEITMGFTTYTYNYSQKRRKQNHDPIPEPRT